MLQGIQDKLLFPAPDTSYAESGKLVATTTHLTALTRRAAAAVHAKWTVLVCPVGSSVLQVPSCLSPLPLNGAARCIW